MMSGVRRYIKNALILVGAALLMRGVSLLFNAYVSQKIGAEGMGLFSLIMSVYGFAVTFATSGINLAVTRLCAEAIGAGREEDVRATLRRAVLHALLFGGVASLTLLLLAEPIGAGLLRDARTIPSLRLLACSMVPIALSSVLSGYFTAVRRVARNALTALFEQGVRMMLTVYGLLALAPAGLTYACLALVGGSALAEFCSFFFLLLQYKLDRRRHARGVPVGRGRGLMAKLLGISMPVALSAYVRSGLVTAEHILIPLCLASNGGDRATALASYGVLHGMALPLILFPTAISSAFSGLLVPEMAEARARGEEGHIRYMAERAISFTLFFSFLSAGLLAACSRELGLLLYGSAEAGRYIRLLAPVAVIMYVDTTVDAILKGLGHQVFSMGVNIADSILSILLVCLLLPRMGAEGYVYVILLAELFNFSLSITRLHNAISFRFSLYRYALAPFLATVGATSLVRLLPLPFSPLGLCLQLLLAALLYLSLLLMLGVFPGKELAWLRSLFRKKGQTDIATLT
ncbi:MAG: oligosaccharide flippase family protein [Clostridia bacterium]|nr:oligosaccharide flippase family protein [Clostridia bacterium]